MLPAAMSSAVMLPAISVWMFACKASSCSVVSCVMDAASMCTQRTAPSAMSSALIAPGRKDPAMIVFSRMFSPETSGTCHVAIFRTPSLFWIFPRVIEFSIPVRMSCSTPTTCAEYSYPRTVSLIVTMS